MNVCNPEKAKELLHRYARDFTAVQISPGLCGAMITAIEAALTIPGEALTKDEKKARRYAVLGWLFNDNKPMSSTDLTNNQWHALRRWTAIDKIGGKWISSRPAFAAEARQILARSIFETAGHVPNDQRQLEFETEKGAQVYDAIRHLGGIVTETHVGSGDDPIPPTKPPLGKSIDKMPETANNSSAIVYSGDLW